MAGFFFISISFVTSTTDIKPVKLSIASAKGMCKPTNCGNLSK